ncbi:MAG TPA: pectin acetylesterase-family hydrolase [Candidatus Limnocylindrales bacterium]|nr:pectin acetylesterase-family hydrolase [Candidatus Limnocylindrales bacterium]
MKTVFCIRNLRSVMLLAALTLLLMGLVVQAQQEPLPAAEALAEGWNRLDVPGAVCALGDPYAFFVRPADPNKLLVYFQGGGACWDRATCGAFGPYDKTVTDAASEFGDNGIFDFTDARNPVSEYTMVVVSYCTGDVHTGSVTETFAGDPPMTIEFRGYDNATAVLDWTFANYPQAETVFVTGTSAGAYGAIFNAARIFDAYPGAGHYVLGDAGVGITPAGWDGFDLWGMLERMPAEQAAPDGSTSINSLLYSAITNSYPEARAAQYTTVGDSVQATFYALMGGVFGDWTPAMRAELSALDAQVGFSSYIAPGASHGILPLPAFYTTTSGGVNFRGWLADWLANEPVEPVTCAECG